LNIFSIFDDLITRPLGFILNIIYGYTGSYGISLIVFTLLLKIVLFPIALKTQKSSNDMARLQPKIAELQKKYKDDKQRQSQELQYLYDDEGVSPAGGCLPNLIQLPIIICLYSVINRPLSFMLGWAKDAIVTIGQFLSIDVVEKTLRQFEIPIANAISGNYDLVLQNLGKLGLSDLKLETIDFHFLGLNLADTPSLKAPGLIWLIPILAALTSLLAGYITNKKATPQPQSQDAAANQAAAMGKAMLIYMPIISLWMGFTLPAGVGLYWLLSNIFSMLQQQIVLKMAPPPVTPTKEDKKQQKVEDKSDSNPKRGK